jgi:outer membrane autotransporter protein
MKRIVVSRKSILRAIHAACVALSLLAMAQREAIAQSYTAPFQVSGSTVTTASGTYGNGAGLLELGANYTSFTIDSSTTINATTPYSGSGSGYANAKSLVNTSASSFSNSGTLTLSSTYTSLGIQAVVALNQGTTPLTVTNSGSISGSLSGPAAQAYVDDAILATATSGDVSITNSGYLGVPSGGYDGRIVKVFTNSGNISFTNSQTGTLTVDTPETAVGFSAFSTTGSITALNAGSIVASANSSFGMDISSGGPVEVTNTGSITAGTYGVRAYGSEMVISNSGAINGGSNSGIYAGGTGISVTNSGSISNTGSAIYAGEYSGPGPVNVINSSTGTITSSTYGIKVGYASAGSIVTLTNDGSITTTSSGIYSAVAARVFDSGNITAPTAISVPSGSSVTLQGRPIIDGTIVGGPTSASTSRLVFDLSIDPSNLAAAQAELKSEIAAYDSQHGGDYTFTVDGLTFVISNFDYSSGVIDDLPVTRHYANTPGFQSMGTVLDHLDTNNAQAAKLLTALGNVTDGVVPSALAELSPKVLQIFSNVADNIATFNAGKINNHLANQRDGLTGFDATALNVQDPGMDPTLNQVRDHLLAYNPAATPGLVSDTVDSLFGGTDMKDMRVNTQPTDRWSSFIAGDVILADLSHNANLEDANYTTGNVTAGVDYRLDEHFTVGALFGYSHTDATLDSRGSSATVDSYSPGIYASYVDKGWYGNGLATYGRNSYSSDRNVNLAGLAGDNHGGTSGNQGTVNLTGGYEIQRGAFKFGPVASVQYVHLSIDSMQEQGPTALDIQSQDEDSFRSQLGVEGRFAANVNTPFGRVGLTPHASLSWQHEYLDDSRGINAQFSGTGGGSFTTQTDNPDRDAAFIDVGLDATVSKNVTVFVDYQTQVGQQNYFAQSAEGGVKIGF